MWKTIHRQWDVRDGGRLSTHFQQQLWNPHVLGMPIVPKMEPRAGCLSLRVRVNPERGWDAAMRCGTKFPSQPLTWETGVDLLFFLSLNKFVLSVQLSFSKRREPHFVMLYRGAISNDERDTLGCLYWTSPALWNPHDFPHIPTQAAEQLGPLFYGWLCQCDYGAPFHLAVSSCPTTTNDGVWEEAGRAQKGRVRASIPLPFSGLPFFLAWWHPLLCFPRYPLNVSPRGSWNPPAALLSRGGTAAVWGSHVQRGCEDIWTASLRAELLRRAFTTP